MTTNTPSYAGATCSTGTTGQTLTLDTLKQVAELISRLPPEPIGEWMRKQGMPPEKWKVILPESFRAKFPEIVFWPRYVQFSKLATGPMFFPYNDVLEAEYIPKHRYERL